MNGKRHLSDFTDQYTVSSTDCYGAKQRKQQRFTLLTLWAEKPCNFSAQRDINTERVQRGFRDDDWFHDIQQYCISENS